MNDPSSLPADSLDQAATRMGADSQTDSPVQRPPGETFASLGRLDTGTDSRSSLTDLPDSEDGDDADREIVDLASRYEFGAVLGRGGMGEVIRATDRRLKRDVAIKRMRAELGASRQAMRRFLTEAISVAALNHFNVVQIFDYGHTADGPFLVMELVEGPTLAELLKDGPLPLEQAVDLLRQLCDGLQTAHLQGIIHRDIKPANILVTASGIPKLTDFGLAKEVDGGGHTVSGAVLGTLDYMAPEQKQDSSLADARSDQWSLAATFYQMLTGDVPRVIEIEAVPEAVREAVRRALKARPAERFDSVREFAEAVQHAADTATRSADSQTQTALKDGQCPDCGTVNDVTRKFCRSCGSSLLGTCPACDAETRVWEQFCGECGTDMPAVLAEHVEAARELKGEIQSLQSSFRHVEALEKLIPLRNSQHAALTEYREWADEAWKRLTGELAELESQRNQLLQTAREQADSGHLSEARRYLARIPGPMQTDETRQLASELAAATAEVKQLAGEIQYAARARLYDGLEQKLNRYLELKPQDQKALALLQKVRERNRRSQTKATGQGASAGKSGTAQSPGTPPPAEKEPEHQPPEEARHENQQQDEPAGEAVLRKSLPRRGLWITVGSAVLLLAGLTWISQPPPPPTTTSPLRSFRGHTGAIVSAAFSPDGQTIVTGSYDDTARLWSVATGQVLSFEGHTGIVNSVAFSPDGQTLATASSDSTARLWSVEDGRLLHTLSGHTRSVEAVVFSPDGQTLATASTDHTARLWSVADGTLLRTLSGHFKGVWSVAFSPDGRTLATTSFDSTARLWAVAEGTLRHTLSGHDEFVVSAVFSPDGQILATASHDHTARLWSVTSGSLLHSLDAHSDGVELVAFSPDGQTLVTGSSDQSARLWSVASGRLLHRLRGHTGSVRVAAFSRDGRMLATGSIDNTTRLWSVADGSALRNYGQFSAGVNSLEFSPDGSLLAAGYSDHVLRLWAVDQDNIAQ